MGLPLHVRNRLENRMLQVTPTLSVSKPFPIDLVIKAAEHIYDPSRFDREKEEAVSDDDSDDTDKVDYSDSEEEEDVRPRLKKKKKTKERKTKETKSKDSDPSTAIPSSQKHVHFPHDKTDEIAELIDKLGKMNINDSNFMPTYFKITAFAPHMVPFLKSPPHQHQDGSSPNAIPPSSGQSIKPPTPSFSRTIECYFCGEKGHGARQCGQAKNMITAGSIVRGDSGRITWSDGTTIIRVGNETIQAAVNRELGNRNKSARTTSYIRQGLPFEDSFSDDEDKADIIVKNGQVYAAVKPKDDKKPRKKDHKDPKKRIIFDGVEIPKVTTTSQGRNHSSSRPSHHHAASNGFRYARTSI